MSEKENWSRDGMICPHCQHLNKPEEAHHYSEDRSEQWCESCGSVFDSSCNISYSWTTNSVDGGDYDD